MEEVSILEAWSLWISSDENLRHRELWGVEILWWGRIGKVVQFIAACAIIAEIVGAEAIRNFGDRLKDLPLVKSADHFFSRTSSLYIELSEFAIDDRQSWSLKKIFGSILYYPSFALMCFVGYQLITKLMSVFSIEFLDFFKFGTADLLLMYFPLSELPFLIIFIFRLLDVGLGLLVAGLLVGAILTAGGTALWLILNFFRFSILAVFTIVKKIILRPISWLLRKESVEIYIKILSLLLLVLGFHFDLLAT